LSTAQQNRLFNTALFLLPTFQSFQKSLSVCP